MQVARSAAKPLVDFSNTRVAFEGKTTAQLLRAWVVFRMSNVRPIVANASSLLRASYSILGKGITNAILRQTFFGHFCGGVDGEDIQPTIRALRQRGVGSILDYAAEADVQTVAPKEHGVSRHKLTARIYDYEGEDVCDANAEICTRAIEAAGEGGFAAIKVTALGQVELLQHMSLILHQTRRTFRNLATSETALSPDDLRPPTHPNDPDFYLKATISRSQLERGLRAAHLDLSPGRVAEVFQELDHDRDGRVDFVEWVSRLSPHDLAHATPELRAAVQDSAVRAGSTGARLSDEQIQRLLAMTERLDMLARTAHERGVRLMVDAEQTYFQPAIDYLVLRLQREYNQGRPVIYNTYQCYLKDAMSRFSLDLQRSQRERFHFALKAVRGAYLVLERQRAAQLGYKDPIHATIEETHRTYDDMVAAALDHHPRTHVIVASHNEDSVRAAVERMAQRGIPSSDEGVAFGQLLGMSDHITYALGAAGYNAYKYLPYGPVEEVIPYLVRRAEENSAVLGKGGRDLAMVQAELLRRTGLRR